MHDLAVASLPESSTSSVVASAARATLSRSMREIFVGAFVSLPDVFNQGARAGNNLEKIVQLAGDRGRTFAACGQRRWIRFVVHAEESLRFIFSSLCTRRAAYPDAAGPWCKAHSQKRRTGLPFVPRQMNQLEIHDLHATIAEQEIIRGLSLTVPKGEVHAIMGPNGSGQEHARQSPGRPSRLQGHRAARS